MSKIFHFPSKILLTATQKVKFPLKSDAMKCIGLMQRECKDVQGFFKGNSVGISANQVGYPYSMFLMTKNEKREQNKPPELEVLINPDILLRSDETCFKWEGCLSDDKMYLVRRPTLVKIKFRNLRGEEICRELSPYKSRIAQHEMDHIRGLSIGTGCEIKELVRLAYLEDEKTYERWFDNQANRNLII